MYVGGILSALLIGALLVVFGLLLDLLIQQGSFEVAVDEVSTVQSWNGQPDAIDGTRAAFRNRGLGSLVHRMRDHRVGSVLQSAYQRFPALGRNQSCLIVLIATCFVIVVVQGLVAYALDLAAQHAAESGVTRLRGALYQQALQVGVSDLMRGRQSVLLELFQDRTDTLRSALANYRRLVPRSWAVVAVCLIIALAIQFLLTVAALLVATILWVLLRKMARSGRPRRALLGERAGYQMAMLTESLQLLPLARGLMLNDMPGQPFDQGLARYRELSTKRNIAESSVAPLGRVLLALGTALILWLVGVNALEARGISLASSVLLLTALTASVPSLRRMALLRPTLDRADRAAEAIFQYLDRSPDVGQTANASDLNPLCKSIGFHEVTVADSNGRKLLDHVSFHLVAGSRVAVVSSDPNTPRAMTSLLPRLLDPASGQVRMDDHDIRQATLSSVRSQTAMVLQEGMIFTGSVTDNIICGSSRYTESDAAEAAREAGADHMIQRLPQAYDTIIGEHGVRLSASDRFHVSLARALLRKPRLLIIEEPPETLSSEEEELVDAALGQLPGGCTVLFMPQRLRTLRSVDHVMVFDRAKLVAQGTHVELLKQSELYRHLHYLQFNQFRNSEA
jgi:ATP-binding cassette subfamily B protein/subfamily B ATP-binding cassette protein MsbA